MTTSLWRYFDLTKIKAELGYRDLVDPVEALSQGAEWLLEFGIGERGERALQDPFDYDAEDRLISAWQALVQSMPDPEFSTIPGYTGSYSGPGGSKRKSDW